MLQAARLGLNVGSIGHVGSDVYGRYMDRIMQQEGIHSVMRIMPTEMQGTPLDETLLCFVLVDPHGRCVCVCVCSGGGGGQWAGTLLQTHGSTHHTQQQHGLYTAAAGGSSNQQQQQQRSRQHMAESGHASCSYPWKLKPLTWRGRREQHKFAAHAYVDVRLLPHSAATHS
jgi:hypothetical protein